jgi:hypothetical protein
MTTFESLINDLARAILMARGLHVDLPTEQLGQLEQVELSDDLLSAQNLATELVLDAYRNGFKHNIQITDRKVEPLSGGMAAQYVFTLASKIKVVCKVDQSEKLAGEARKLIALKDREGLVPDLVDRFPRIYAAKIDAPPYAYVMEQLPSPPYVKLSDCLLNPRDHDLTKIGPKVIDTLLRLYGATVDRTLIPNLTTIYLDRIVDRIRRAGSLDAEFSELSKGELRVNNDAFCDLSSYVKDMQAALDRIAPRFVTFVHGDPHPGNVLIDSETLEPRFIDVKDWYAGDYIWDIGKLIHYTLVTSPVEDLRLISEKPEFRVDDCRELSYAFDVPQANSDFAGRILESVRRFADSTGDRYWEARLYLSIAANLLGLPEARLERRMRDSAFICFGEGLRWFSRSTAMLRATNMT